MHLTERERREALYEIFRRDIEENPNFSFRGRLIRPFKGEEPEMQLLFSHLITHDVEENQNGQTIKRREFEMMRAQRLHWIWHHIQEKHPHDMELFSVEERHQSRWVIKTYILDKQQRYVIILEPYRKQPDYYLITAYHLQDRSFKKIMQKLGRRLPVVH
ncbi:hypothetical protein [Larkinella sp. C7]|uniref:hypothetical protein n=1 Tax=Larkinella sp. C7 TaxID=2576607 RepID=UPI001BB26975|nr:hypothetical protein [Larkinella sp. C7]